MNWLYILRGKPKYCKSCGSKLIATEYADSFHRRLGYPTKMGKRICCPNYECKFLIANGHDNYTWSKKYKEEKDGK